MARRRRTALKKTALQGEVTVAKTKRDCYVLYYTHGARGRETLWYAEKAPGDGGKDWSYTKNPAQAGVFSFRHLQRWVSERGKTSGWRVTACPRPRRK